jgi:hypothetical protein
MRRVRRVVVAAAVIVLVATATLPAAAAAERTWDPRIAPLVGQVERLRGLTFQHPVPVEVLDDAAFERRYSRDQTLTKSDRKELARTNSVLLAAGLIDDPVDPEAVRAAYRQRVLGFYDPKHEEIVVRGSDFDSPAARAVLAHELTHALQDQHFGLKKLTRKASDTESAVPRALIEGDASRVGRLYGNALSAEERAQLESASSETDEPTLPLPPILAVSASGPYALGEIVVSLLEATGQQAAIDAAFEDPPLDDIVLIDPVALLDPFSAAEVPEPELARGERRLGASFPFGAWGLFLTLAARLPVTDALAAAERWGGDSYIVFRRGSTPCFRMTVAGRGGSAGAETLATAFRAWTAAAPSDAQTEVSANTVMFTTCAPPDAAPVSEAALARAFFALVYRNRITQSAMASGRSATAGKCIADETLRVPEVAAWIDTITTTDTGPAPGAETAAQRALQQSSAAIRSRCA